MEKVFLIYNEEETRINQFSINKYIEGFKAFNIDCILLTDTNYKFISYTPLCVINRTNNYHISQFFENLGIRVFNNSTVTKICNNKLDTYNFLGKEIQHLQIYNENDEYDLPIIIKDPTSKGGKDVFLIENKNQLAEIYKPYMIKQKFLPNACDIRTYIIGNEIILSLKRYPKTNFKANYKINHNAEVYTLKANEKKLINKILKKFNFDYVGIDILKSGNEFYFSEIEDSVGARAVYDLTDIDIINLYVNYIYKQIKKQTK